MTEQTNEPAKREPIEDGISPSGSRNCYLMFVRATVALLQKIRNNPTPAKIDYVLDDLQVLTLEQE